jgi:sugar (pentulose or hexulose) kinase
VARGARITTLAGYVHWKLTGRYIVGINEASGMFPIDPSTGTYDARAIAAFDTLVADKGYTWKSADLLPEIGRAGDAAGTLTADGARLFDPRGRVGAGIPMCPPEGDAGTGMVATNSTRPRTGNVSAGTSVFAMLVLEKPLSRVHPEIDIVLTPDGNPVGMVHSNNCTSDLDAWVTLIAEACSAIGTDISFGDAIAALTPLALEADQDAGGLLSFGYVSGEHVTGFHEGRPLFVRQPDGAFTIRNFMRAHLNTALCALRAGLEILVSEEGVSVDQIRGHGGYFKTPGVGQRIMAAATGSAVSLLETSGEGGAWGMALLAAFAIRENTDQTLADFLDEVFSDASVTVMEPDPDDVRAFEQYFSRYMKGLPIERAAVDHLE